MKNTFTLRRAPWLLSINLGVAILFSGCSTPEQHSFNSDFNEKLPVNPMYSIQDKDADHFIIRVHQGTPSTGAERVINVKEAASTIAKAESQKRGWEKWELNYIREQNQGWMHVVVAEVTRK